MDAVPWFTVEDVGIKGVGECSPWLNNCFSARHSGKPAAKSVEMAIAAAMPFRPGRCCGSSRGGSRARPEHTARQASGANRS